jgi:hypothetical protein
MVTVKTIRRIALYGSLVLSAAAVLGCGAKPAAQSANVVVGEMPEGADWKGVYFSQVYGNLHLQPDGGEMVGKWRTVAGDSTGELRGKTDGNVLRYEWTERKIGMIGPSASRSGKGYFKYLRPKGEEGAKNPDEIEGEWGLGEKDSGNSWKAVKQANREPDFKSVEPDEVETAGSAAPDSWDKGAGSAEGADEKEKEK